MHSDNDGDGPQLANLGQSLCFCLWCVCLGRDLFTSVKGSTRQSIRGWTSDRPIPRCVSNEISGDERPTDNEIVRGSSLWTPYMRGTRPDQPSPYFYATDGIKLTLTIVLEGHGPGMAKSSTCCSEARACLIGEKKT